jgi:hypothetical protein
MDCASTQIETRTKTRTSIWPRCDATGFAVTYATQRCLAGAMFGAGISALDTYVRRQQVHAFKPTWRGWELARRAADISQQFRSPSNEAQKESRQAIHGG